ncbi:MAG TPA: TetR/AcrR family transcriptional regulator C-terminal domain-containing protein [Chloroflexota bacterium]|nr:TetR/AcrR family transcriptional regulator C-terminal domain-containing protein [Chloroflexota bacterium]
MAVPVDRRVPLNRERVLRAAMELADEGGLDALSMRKLGHSLGVEAMSLYNHVTNKDDLLDGIADLVLAEFKLPSQGEDWEEAIWKCAISGHDALLRHSWACNLIMSSSRIRPSRLRYMESILACFRQAGFSPEETSHAYHAVDSHILGFTLWQLGHVMPATFPQIRSKEELAVLIATWLPGLSIGEFPYLLEHAEQHLRVRRPDEEGAFELVLRLILDGLKRMRDAF